MKELDPEVKPSSPALEPTASLEEAKSVHCDDLLLMSMGKKPELKRVYNFWTCRWPSSACFTHALETCFGFFLLPHDLLSQPCALADITFCCEDYSMRLSDHDLLQLVVPGRTVFDHLRCWRPVWSDMGNVSPLSLATPTLSQSKVFPLPLTEHLPTASRSLFVAVGQTLLMASLAEYTSIWPTAGGQQYYTQAVARGRWRPFLSYVVGWAVLVGEISTSSSCAVNSAAIVASFVEITHPEVSWHPWMTWITYSIFLVMPILLNLRPSWLPGINVLGAVWTIAGGVVWAVVFGVMAPKHDAHFVFELFINNSGYQNNVFVFIMSFYNPMYGLYGTDGIMHLVEEMRDASREAPRVMVWSMIFCSVTSWLAGVLMMWTAGNWESYMDAAQPYMNWFMDVTGSVIGGGMFCALLMMGLNLFIIVGTNNASSRLAWSMARDQGLPYSKYFATVSARFHIPLRAMVAVLVVELVIGESASFFLSLFAESCSCTHYLRAKISRLDHTRQRFSIPEHYIRWRRHSDGRICNAGSRGTSDLPCCPPSFPFRIH
jgi:hypothetical protein